jgi:FkbM family methyltransferase
MYINFLLTRLKKLSYVFQSTRFLKALLLHRVLAGAEHRKVFVANLELVVDIGANRGQFTLAARKWARKARVIAFEPLAEAAASFRKVFQGDLRVTIHQVAIGKEAGEASIHVSAAEDSTSLLPISTLQNRIFPGTFEIRTEMVKIRPLSDFIVFEEIVCPAMLKLDVQGYELEVLKGCEVLLDRFSYVYAECSFVELYSGQALADEIIAWLRKRGWRLSGIYNMIYGGKGQSVQADFLFENSCYMKPSSLMNEV